MPSQTAIWGVMACVLALFSPLAKSQCQYSVTVLPEIDCFLGGPPEPVAINNLGHVIAYYDCGPGRTTGARLA